MKRQECCHSGERVRGGLETKRRGGTFSSPPHSSGRLKILPAAARLTDHRSPHAQVPEGKDTQTNDLKGKVTPSLRLPFQVCRKNQEEETREGRKQAPPTSVGLYLPQDDQQSSGENIFVSRS